MIPTTNPARGPSPRPDQDLAGYLLHATTDIRDKIDAAEVAVYLVEAATSRLRLSAWAAFGRSGTRTGSDTPPDLTHHGIDGADLTAATLRNFVHAAPAGRRLALPLHDGDSWVGAVVAVAGTAFEREARAKLSSATSEMSGDLRSSGADVSFRIVADPESSIDLPSEPILGRTAADGVSYAPAFLYETSSARVSPGKKIEESREEALLRLDQAIELTRSQLERLTTDKSNELYDVVSLLFSTHVLMLTDDSFSGAMRSLVEAGQTPEDAVQSIVASFVRTFGKLREARLAEKAQDVRDIGFRILQNLSGVDGDGQDFTERIVVVEDILPSDLIRLALGHAAGVVIFGATVTAHISILAQSLGLPTLLTDDRTALEIVEDTMLLLDAGGGRLFPSPSAEQLAEYGYDPDAGFQCCGFYDDEDRPAKNAYLTADGERVTILSNVNLLSDARRGEQVGAEGIGLYRSEFPFIIRNDFIPEEEQYRVYRSVVESVPGKPVILRTADIGGDKLMAGREQERNPFLGVRGIRFSLANRSLFKRQLRAMLRAGAGADLGIMFPMVASHEEIEDAREEVELCIAALRQDGLEHNDHPRIGAMVELPSAVIDIEELATRTDFLSIGTNDLIMYLLAVDRTNERLSELYRSHHPIVLRTLAEVSARVDPVADDLSVCGESASDPLMIPFYLALGIRKLSVAPRQVASTASAIARRSLEDAGRIRNELLAIRSLREMEGYVQEFASQPA